MTSFHQQLLLTLLDKGALALIALLLGYWISRRLEDYRNAQKKMSDLERDKVVLQNEIEKNKRTREIEFREKQLSSFYWPVYFRFVKDSALWRIIPQLSDTATRIPDRIGREIELNYLIKNQEEIVSLIESNIYLAGADEELAEGFAAYIRHVAVYRALRATNTYDLNPIDVGEPFPDGIIPAIEGRLKKLQSDYERLVNSNIGTSQEKD
jgi:hypothetical protein